MTKSTITREQLEEWVAQFDEDGGCDATDRQLEALIRQSLAAMDSEPVIVVGDDGGDALSYRRLIQSFEPGTKLYRHAHPAPVVPTFDEWLELSGNKPLGWVKDVMRESYDACRAAMLERQLVDRVDEKSLTSINPAPDLVSLQKKAESIIGNYPGIPDGYVMVPKEPTDEMLAAAKEWTGLTSTAEVVYIKMLAAAPQLPGSEPATVPGKWIPVSERMPEAGGDMIVFTGGIVMSGVSYAKKKGFYIQALEYDDDEPVDSVTHWMPLPASPQEVKGE